MSVAKPFVKWVGGKSRSLQFLDSILAKDFDMSTVKRYVEPFLGGGAMLFHMLTTYPSIETAVGNDLNNALIQAYRDIKYSPDALIAKLHSMSRQYALHDDLDRLAYYNQIKSLYNSRDSASLSAEFIFLNKTCFNRLYRENSKGEFNVPFGKYSNPHICDEETIRADHAVLRRCILLSCDFEDIIESELGDDTFIYLDPPYRNVGFTKYVGSDFTESDQRRLALSLKELTKRGVKWMVTNADTDDGFYEELYEGCRIRHTRERTSISCTPESRNISIPIVVITSPLT